MKRSHLLLIAMLLAGIGNAPLAAKELSSAPQTLALDQCSWDRPGVNPFMGDVVAAVDRYRDIPVDVRERLKSRMAKREYDDLVEIRRDSMIGRGGYEYGNSITDMHFGTHQVCRTVTRKSWTPQMQERGLVYCESGHCILVPTVCRNVSRVTRRGVGPATAENTPLLGDAPAVPPMMAEALPPIEWDGPTGAGLPDAAPLDAGPIGFADAPPVAGAPIGWGGGVPPIGGFGLPVMVAGLGGGGGSEVPWLTIPKPPRDTVPPLPAPPITTPVPEPQTWALMLAGLAAGALIRRRAVRR